MESSAERYVVEALSPSGNIWPCSGVLWWQTVTSAPFWCPDQFVMVMVKMFEGFRREKKKASLAVGPTDGVWLYERRYCGRYIRTSATFSQTYRWFDSALHCCSGLGGRVIKNTPEKNVHGITLVGSWWGIVCLLLPHWLSQISLIGWEKVSTTEKYTDKKTIFL